MEKQIEQLLSKIVEDYADFSSDFNHPRITEFEEGLEVIEGRKYLKVIRNAPATGGQKSVWGFIVKEDDKKFSKGDILKPASWATPARNKARGNIFEEYSIRWTGPNYL